MKVGEKYYSRTGEDEYTYTQEMVDDFNEFLKLKAEREARWAAEKVPFVLSDEAKRLTNEILGMPLL